MSPMRANMQPYRSIKDLHDEIDANPEADDLKVVIGLEKVAKKYKNLRFAKVIHKPRILYSMEVSR